MAASERAAKDRQMAAYLKSRDIYHGKRTTKPAANSGGLTMTFGNGSAKNQRRLAALKNAN